MVAGPAFPIKENVRLWAVVGMRSAGAKVRVNFGHEEFRWRGTYLEEDPDEDEQGQEVHHRS
jgi:hypothetical protein